MRRFSQLLKSLCNLAKLETTSTTHTVEAQLGFWKFPWLPHLMLQVWQNVLNISVSLYIYVRVTFVDLISSSVSTRSAPMLSNWDFRPAMSSLRLGSFYFSVVSYIYLETVVKMSCLVITHYLPIPDNINSLHPHCLCYLDHCLTHLKKFRNIIM